MNITVLTDTFQALQIVDDVESFLWIERFNRVSEFEIYTKFSDFLAAILIEDRYISIADSDKLMIIEDVKIVTDPELGARLKVTGRSLESVLDRRILMEKLIVDTSFQSGILSILTATVINGTYPERNFPNFIFSSSSDPAITGLTLKGQYYANILLDIIESLCAQANVGFKLVLNASNQLVFSLYSGTDRSYSQSTNPYVIFSPNFDNLVNSEYFRTKRYKKTYVLIQGSPDSSPEGTPGFPIRAQTWPPGGPLTGLNRREMFLDASNVSIYLDNSSTRISDSDYSDQLEQLGQEELARYTELTSFNGQIDLTNSYKYKVDFFLGDIIQIEDAYGHNSRSQITEMTLFEDLRGSSLYPTLKAL